MAEYLGLSAVEWAVMLRDWWNQLLASLSFATLALGLSFVCFLAILVFKKRRQHPKSPRSLPHHVTSHIYKIKTDTPKIFPYVFTEKAAKSFGVYLGSFSNPATEHEKSLLTRWEIIIVDPEQTGVLEALSLCTATRILGRLDIEAAVRGQSLHGRTGEEKAIQKVVECFFSAFVWSKEAQSPLNGILIANWQKYISTSALNCLIEALNGVGLGVYLELNGPQFLSANECDELDLETCKGIIARNGTILHHGDRRDYYQMAEMRRALRALARKSQMSEGHVLMWDTVDDGVALDHSVVKRSYNWCRFYSALNYIGSVSSLTNAEAANQQMTKCDPLSALSFLKDDQIVKIHESWRLNEKIAPPQPSHHDAWNSLDHFVPNLSEKLMSTKQTPSCSPNSTLAQIQSLEWANRGQQKNIDPFAFSPLGHSYTGLGCFQIGLDCTHSDFEEILNAQRRLKSLGLLQSAKPEILERAISQFRKLRHYVASSKEDQELRRAVDDLLQLLTIEDTTGQQRLNVWMGLHSGFRTKLSNRFWGIYDFEDPRGERDIYISLKATDFASTLLHTFLSSKQYSRTFCLLGDVALAKANNLMSKDWRIPQRLVTDVEGLTPTEAIIFLRQLRNGSSQFCGSLAQSVSACIKHQLLEVPTTTQLRKMNSIGYASGEVSVKEMIESRLKWHQEQGCEHPDAASAVALFEEISIRLPQILFNQDEEALHSIHSVLKQVLRKGQIDAGADIFALSFFCALRKLGMAEVYLEILDRNPLPNSHPDQAACFAEMFALGSRCEAYFDMTPNAFGRILADRYQAYYRANQPPRRGDKEIELPTAYASKQVDLNPKAAAEKIPWYYQITFLGIFAFPALIDIMLLTTIGRGLYLSSYMTEDEKLMATTALMVALFLTGAIGTWIGSGGSYYLHSMAFPAMNMFVLTRWIAGVALAFVGGLVGFIVIAISKGPYPAAVFFLYLVLLTVYLTTLAGLAIYQFPDFMFQSGRSTVVICVPILFISPVLTLFIGNDITVYLCVIASFLTCLLIGGSRVLSKWTTWYLDIPFVSDQDVVKWYTETCMTDASDLPPGITDISTTPLPRMALEREVQKERSKRFWTKPTTDQFVLRVVKGYPAASFLMSWYCKYSRTEMPFPYSTTWNLQSKAAIDTLKDMQKGLKFHNAFVHWRQGSNEVYCGILYFVIALMDKWTALLSGGSIVGLSAADSEDFRLPVGFALAYYLISAIALDAVAQPLWPTANRNEHINITSLENLRDVASQNASSRRNRYWKNLAYFFFTHMWALCIASILMWTFGNNEKATVMYLAYLGSYTGLLLYQYNRIFTGSSVLPDLLLSAAIGLISGPLVRHFHPKFDYGGVISLAVATWTAALLSMRTAKVGWPKVPSLSNISSPVKAAYYCGSGLGRHFVHSQVIISETFNAIQTLPSDARYSIDPTEHPGSEVMSHLQPLNILSLPSVVHLAFPTGNDLIREVVDMWSDGRMVVELVSSNELSPKEQKLKYVARHANGILHLYVITTSHAEHGRAQVEIQSNCKIAAEIMLQVVAEARFGMFHEHAILAKLLAVGGHTDQRLELPQSIVQHLSRDLQDCDWFFTAYDEKMLQHFLLNLQCDREWDLLPGKVRSTLLRRCLGDNMDVSHEFMAWVHSKFGTGFNFEQHVGLCNLGATLTAQIEAQIEAIAPRAISSSSSFPYRRPSEARAPSYLSSEASEPHTNYDHVLRMIPNPILRIHQAIKVAMKFCIVSLVADPEFQRELDYVMSEKPAIVRAVAKFLLNGTWVFCRMLQDLILPLVFINGRPQILKLYKNMKGTRTTMLESRCIIESAIADATCFFDTESDGAIQVSQYSGLHTKEPADKQKLVAVNTYTHGLVLQRKQEYTGGSIIREYVYEYRSGDKLKIPITRKCVRGSPEHESVQYDENGSITSGSYLKDGNLISFKYNYSRKSRSNDDLLGAEFVLGHMTIKVSWSTAPFDAENGTTSMVADTRVVEATFSEGSNKYHSKWIYDHKSHPVITTTLNGQETDTPPMIEHDWFKVLKKPIIFSFADENPLRMFKTVGSSRFTRLIRKNTKVEAISTSCARNQLWKLWRSGKNVDVITARWLDEWVLRSDRTLRPYWIARDMGRLNAAKKYLHEHADILMSVVDLDNDVSSWTCFAFKTSDLYSFGLGGDTTINTRHVSTQLYGGKNNLNVLAMDTGTWPNEGGGVSACRRDMVNDLKSIKWHIVAECANDYNFPKFQIERNVQSLTVLPLWGLDYLTPSHGIFENVLDSQIQEKSHNTSDQDIKRKFIPILKTLIRCARAIKLEDRHIEEATKALLDLNKYFETSRHWSDIWMSDVVKDAWRELWLAEDMENTRPISQWLDAEHPTLAHLDNALDMWQRYLFIFSLPVPERIPEVFQASHHFAGASYGIICKLKRGCAFHVWDHCISWREVTVFLSSAMSFDSSFVCTSLISLSRILSVLTLHHADVVLPCADFFNPGWEVELGSIEGTLCHRKTYARKIDPVVNGICNMEKFEPIEKITSEKPTAVMLSHIRFVKDIKNAILAADIIINEWGIKDYRLDVYGDMERAPAYATECQEIIAAKGLRDFVILRGLGSPSKVLQQAWLFLNSSVSEGLPLAMGEAALTGVPVVCTDVGASFRVVTDQETGKPFSAVCPPNDAYALAKAQVNIMGLLGEWSEFAEDPEGFVPPELPLKPTPEQSAAILQRMYDKVDQRRRLGMKGRANVLSSFSSERYLREHEQMLWLAKHQSKSYRTRTGPPTSDASSGIYLDESKNASYIWDTA